MKHDDPSHAAARATRRSSATRRAPAAATTRCCKLWLRMLACTTQIEAEIRQRLRERFGISLARFDYLAQLYRYQDGLKMSELSRYLMVTGGNVTGLTDELEREGLVARESEPGRPARLDRAPHAEGPAQLRDDGARARALDPRALRRPRRRRTVQQLLRAARARCACSWCSNEQAARGRRHERRTTAASTRRSPPATAGPLAGYAAEHFRGSVERRRRHASR